MHPRLALPLVAAALAAVPSPASARPLGAGFAATYPHASVLCARADAGALPRRIAADASAITGACTALQTSYSSATQTFTTAVAPVPGEVQTILASVASARQSGDRTALVAARGQARIDLRTLRGQVRADVLTLRASIGGARVTFWSAVRVLPGAAGLPADNGSGSAPAAPVVPMNP